MPPSLSPTIIQSRSFLQLTCARQYSTRPPSSTRQSCLPRPVSRPSVLRPPPLHPLSFSSSSTSFPRHAGPPKNHNDNLGSATRSSPYSSSAKGSSSGTSSNPGEDEHEFPTLDAAQEPLLTKLRSDLVKLRPGGLNVEALEALKVDYKRPNVWPLPQWKVGDNTRLRQQAKEKVKQEMKEKVDIGTVGDLAQVMVRGRVCVVMAGEKEHIKSLFSSISSLSLPAPPTIPPGSPLEIHIPIPPTTGESRAEALQAAKQLGDKALDKWAEARSAERKRIRGSGKAKMSKDTALKGEGRLTKAYEKVVVEIKSLVENAQKRLARG